MFNVIDKMTHFLITYSQDLKTNSLKLVNVSNVDDTNTISNKIFTDQLQLSVLIKHGRPG